MGRLVFLVSLSMSMRLLVSVWVWVCVCSRRCVLALFPCVTAFACMSTWYSPQPPDRAAPVKREENGWERRRRVSPGPGELAGWRCSCSEKAASSYDRQQRMYKAGPEADLRRGPETARGFQNDNPGKRRDVVKWALKRQVGGVLLMLRKHVA